MNIIQIPSFHLQLDTFICSGCSRIQNFLLEGCLSWEFDIVSCLAIGLMPPLTPVLVGLKAATDKIPGASLNLGSINLEACVYLKTLGFEDPSCSGGVGGLPKYMPLNPVRATKSIIQLILVCSHTCISSFLTLSFILHRVFVDRLLTH